MTKTNPGNYFEDFAVGQTLPHATPRTVTEGDLGDVVTATGTIAISDVDSGDSPDFADTTVSGAYGDLVLVAGNWTYTLDQATALKPPAHRFAALARAADNRASAISWVSVSRVTTSHCRQPAS